MTCPRSRTGAGPRRAPEGARKNRKRVASCRGMLVGDASCVTVFEAEAASSRLDGSWLGPGLTKPSLRRGGVDAEASFASPQREDGQCDRRPAGRGETTEPDG